MGINEGSSVIVAPFPCALIDVDERLRRSSLEVSLNTHGVLISYHLFYFNSKTLLFACEVLHKVILSDARMLLRFVPQRLYVGVYDALDFELANHLLHGRRGVDYNAFDGGVFEDGAPELELLGAVKDFGGKLGLDGDEDAHGGGEELVRGGRKPKTYELMTLNSTVITNSTSRYLPKTRQLLRSNLVRNSTPKSSRSILRHW